MEQGRVNAYAWRRLLRGGQFEGPPGKQEAQGQGVLTRALN